jgi:hypothetical protein
VPGFQPSLGDPDGLPLPATGAGTPWPPASDRIASPYGAPPTAEQPDGSAADPFASSSAGAGNFLSAIEGIFSQLASLVAGLLGTATGTPAAPKPEYARASLSSTGDPHDTFSGTTASGSTQNAKWDDSASHSNLISSDSFTGGYRVATTVTALDARGATMNASATVIANGGATSVQLDEDGSYTVTSDGKSLQLETGVLTNLGNGETVTRENDGSLVVAMQNSTGGSIATTLRTNGDGGVDVSAQAENADLAGYLVTGATAQRPGPIHNWPIRE